MKINTVIEEENLKYGIQYPSQLDSSDGQLINHRLFLETLLLRLMVETLSFSTKHKSKQFLKEKSLIEITNLEQKK